MRFVLSEEMITYSYYFYVRNSVLYLYEMFEPKPFLCEIQQQRIHELLNSFCIRGMGFTFKAWWQLR